MGPSRRATVQANGPPVVRIGRLCRYRESKLRAWLDANCDPQSATVERYPPPPGILPKTGQRPALSYLYPVEDERLLACPLVPFELRLLYGFLAREGLRLGEALALCWRHVDPKHGTARLEHTKTGDTRAWALDPGTAKALAAVRESL